MMMFDDMSRRSAKNGHTVVSKRRQIRETPTMQRVYGSKMKPVRLSSEEQSGECWIT